MLTNTENLVAAYGPLLWPWLNANGYEMPDGSVLRVYTNSWWHFGDVIDVERLVVDQADIVYLAEYLNQLYGEAK